MIGYRPGASAHDRLAGTGTGGERGQPLVLCPSGSGTLVVPLNHVGPAPRKTTSAEEPVAPFICLLAESSRRCGVFRVLVIAGTTPPAISIKRGPGRWISRKLTTCAVFGAEGGTNRYVNMTGLFAASASLPPKNCSDTPLRGESSEAAIRSCSLMASTCWCTKRLTVSIVACSPCGRFT